MIFKSAVMGRDRGTLIVCEGISGSGKSEGVKALLESIRAKNLPVAFFEWNSNPVIRKIIQIFHTVGILSPTIYSILQWLGFMLDYNFKILPLLLRNCIVIVDRYVYTGLTRDIVNKANLRVGKAISSSVRKPDLLLFYDTGLLTCYERIKNRNKILFHPNRLIHRNPLLKNKDLYYLKKLLSQYYKLIHDPEFRKTANVIIVTENDHDIPSKIEEFVAGKYKILESHLAHTGASPVFAKSTKRQTTRRQGDVCQAKTDKNYHHDNTDVKISSSI
jgi:dTMP kinase